MFGITFGNIIASTAGIQVKLEIKKNIFIFHLQGEFASTESKTAMNSVFDAIISYHPIIFNCKKLDFIDAYTMRKILELYEKLHAAGHSIIFTHLSPGIKGVMRSNGILDIIAHYSNDKNGMKALEKNDFSDALPVYPSESRILG